MFAQFQASYPTGGLISELLTIYQGKFVVRVLAQVEGITRATGIAAAETPELAEDRARIRALEVLAIDGSTALAPYANETADLSDSPLSLEPAPIPEQPMQIKSAFSLLSIKKATQTRPFATASELKEQAPSSTQVSLQSEEFSPSSYSVLSTPGTDSDDAEKLGMMTSTQNGSSGEAAIAFSNATPLVPLSYSPDAGALSQASADNPEQANAPVDLSDALARTSVELKRLRWSNQQGRDYLKRTYGKQLRKDLNDEEMLEFLHYLEIQPTPNEPFA